MQNVSSDASAAGSCPRWVKSSFSYANGDCVQVARQPDGRIGIRDSKDPGGPVLLFAPSEWAAFVSGVQNGEFIDVLAG